MASGFTLGGLLPSNKLRGAHRGRFPAANSPQVRRICADLQGTMEKTGRIEESNAWLEQDRRERFRIAATILTYGGAVFAGVVMLAVGLAQS